MNYIILDLEATCWKDRSVQKQNEIIEIGAIKMNDSGESSSEFCEFIKPKINPTLSDFCIELTTITQNEIDNAGTYNEVIERFKKWINLDEPYMLCSWGFYDKKQFQKDCELHNLDTDWLQNHVSLKHQYADIKNLKKPIGMGGALKKENLTLEGTHHRGIDDARNIAKIFQANLGKWKIKE
ncbi:3'-5' exonuclease [Aquimarina algiphila]|uniref:3'-5' exonuclease n=1 Tax=Aquimarina algiphila TaxID=2047982 RepID=UPI00249264E4|nr:3'-5' exonuclease [Aquimarina algiphila]